MIRYLKLYRAFARVSLLGELAFRGNFLIKIFVELCWLGLMVFFYDKVFDYTAAVAGWSKAEYFFFIGCYYIIESVNEALFLSNFGEFSELVRTGNLDLVLLKPVDEQFLISCRHVEWSSVPNALFGFSLLGRSLYMLDWSFDPLRIVAFAVSGVCAVSMAYSFMLMLSATSVWLVRNQSLYEVWWLFMSLMRYPKEVFDVSWARMVGKFFTFVIPVVLATNVPASSMVKALDFEFVLYLAVSAGLLMGISRWVFRRALRSYRSASS